MVIDENIDDGNDDDDADDDDAAAADDDDDDINNNYKNKHNDNCHNSSDKAILISFMIIDACTNVHNDRITPNVQQNRQHIHWYVFKHIEWHSSRLSDAYKRL